MVRNSARWKISIFSFVIFILALVALTGCGEQKGGEAGSVKGASSTTSAGQGQTGAPQKAEFVLRFAQANSASDNTSTWADRFFCRRVEELTGGRVKVEYYPSAMLGANERQYGEQLMTGVLDIAHINTASMSPIVPELEIVHTPFLIQNREQYYYMWWNTRLGEYLRKKMEEKNLVLLSPKWCNSRSIFGNRPIKSVEDLKGLKIRVMQSDSYMEAFKLLGAAPVPMPYGEVYSALQTGTVDAAENTPETLIVQKFAEVAKNLSLTRHSGCTCTITASAITLKKLPPELREAVLQAGKEYAAYYQGCTTFEWRQTLDKVKAAGVNVVEFDRTGVEDKLKPLYDKLREKYGEDLYKDIMLVREKFPLGYKDNPDGKGYNY